MPKLPMNYSNTVIYKIVCKDLAVTDVYVGSTTDFRKRKCEHKRSCNNETHKRHNLKVYQYIRDNGGWDNFEMIEIEKYLCNDGNESRARERYWYEILNAKLNTIRPTISEEEHLAYHKQYRERKNRFGYKQYYETYKETQIEYKKQQYTCECGSIGRIGDKARHLKTKKHQQFITNNNIPV